MGLDINTPKGQETLQQERRAIAIWHSHFPHLVYNETPKEEPALIDGVLTHNGFCRGVVETKCRDMDLATFTNTHDEQWLVTHGKLIEAKNVASSLCVPLLGFLYLVPTDMLLWAKLWDPLHGWVRSFSVQKTETQATVNGGKALRDNAFINMRKCDQLRLKPCQTTDQSAKNTV